jgi:uncharacterized membrane protein
MRATVIVGIVLIVAGAVALAARGISYTREREVVDIGPISATAETRERVDIPVWAGGIAIAAGVVLILVGRQRA